MKPAPSARIRLAHVLSQDRALPDAFHRLREDTTVVLATEPVLADDGMVLDGPWDLSRYQLNPVVLWAHNAARFDNMPIGRAIQTVETSPGTVYAEIEWDRDDPAGAAAARKFEKGFLSAVSIRWESATILHTSKLPQGDPRRDEDYWVCQGNRLIEISAVPIGALDTALAQRSARDDLQTLLRDHPELRMALEETFLSLPAPPRQGGDLQNLFAAEPEDLSALFGDPS